MRRLYGQKSSLASKIAGVLLVAFGLASVVLLLLGLWIMLAIAFSVLVAVALVRGLFRGNGARKPEADGPRVIEGHATTLRDEPASDDIDKRDPH
jgi:hypothetical protein